ncbi:MAG: hypothetical protein R2877_02200 [Bdellovibrionota bacterium]
MKKIMFAAVAALFAVSAHAGDKAKMVEVAGATEESCKAEKNTWKNGKCWKSEMTATTTTTTTTAPATTAPAAK